MAILVEKEVFSTHPCPCDGSCQENLPHFCESTRGKKSESNMAFDLLIWVGSLRVSRFQSFAFHY